MQVWLYPEKMRAELGATRWLVTWQELRHGARWKVGSEEVEIDFDRDLIEQAKAFAQLSQARLYARALVDDGRTFFGVAEIQQQRVDWFVKEDRVAEWADVGRSEIVE